MPGPLWKTPYIFIFIVKSFCSWHFSMLSHPIGGSLRRGTWVSLCLRQSPRPVLVEWLREWTIQRAVPRVSRQPAQNCNHSLGRSKCFFFLWRLSKEWTEHEDKDEKKGNDLLHYLGAIKKSRKQVWELQRNNAGPWRDWWIESLFVEEGLGARAAGSLHCESLTRHDARYFHPVWPSRVFVMLCPCFRNSCAHELSLKKHHNVTLWEELGSFFVCLLFYF